MITVIIFCICIVLAAIAGVIVFVRKTNATINARMLALLNRNMQLDQLECDINVRSQAIHHERMTTIQMLQETKKSEKQTQDLLESNKAVIKGNETQLYHIKESVVYLHDHYKKVVEILGDLRTGKGVEPEELNKTLEFMNGKLTNIDNYFLSVFKLTPEQYIKSKQNIVGRPKDNGYDYITESSLN